MTPRWLLAVVLAGSWETSPAALGQRVATSPDNTHSTANLPHLGGASISGSKDTVSATRIKDRVSEAPHDLTAFERTVLPTWLRLFQLRDADGRWVNEYSHSANLVPGKGTPSVYGSSDVIHILFTTNQLNLTDANRTAWVTHLGGFQNASIACWSSPKVPCPDFPNSAVFTGFWRLATGESGGWEPWHVTGEGAAGLRLLGAYPPHRNTLYEEVAINRSLWEPTIAPLVKVLPNAGCDNFHACAHKLIGLGASLAMTNATSTTDFAPFLHWLADYLVANIDNSTGLWCTAVDKARGTPGLFNCLGGSFAAHMFLHAVGTPWPYNRTLQSLALSLQSPNGSWGGGAVSGYMNVDAIYQITRSLPSNPDRTAAARAACDKYLATAVPTMSSLASFVVLTKGTTHEAAAPIAAVAECTKWFPDLVVSDRPWRFSGDYAPFL
eukprot:m.16006 g.16006  ORF g.16006 m.16006 type:complete len:439 (+) comp4996_c0_seq1:3417-4733(+)